MLTLHNELLLDNHKIEPHFFVFVFACRVTNVNLNPNPNDRFGLKQD